MNHETVATIFFDTSVWSNYIFFLLGTPILFSSLESSKDYCYLPLSAAVARFNFFLNLNITTTNFKSACKCARSDIHNLPPFPRSIPHMHHRTFCIYLSCQMTFLTAIPPTDTCPRCHVTNVNMAVPTIFKFKSPAINMNVSSALARLSLVKSNHAFRLRPLF